jgi:hypothetical protein
MGAKKLGCGLPEAADRLEQLGRRFFDEDSPIRRACDEQMTELLRSCQAPDGCANELVDIFRRYVRTPSFLVRFFPLDRERLDADAMAAAMESPDQSGLTLRELLAHFLLFLVERCGEEDRRRYIEAVSSIQTGSYLGSDVTEAYEADGKPSARSSTLPNVRLVNGGTRQDIRQRLMLAFNTPFYPEILVASSVMAEGVDLHLSCRYVIHHDLCWNPSTLEQRTGRIDRIGAKAERCGQPIYSYLPYVAETQDEKMYRVVMDRERWFNVVMGESYRVDVRSTDRLAQRIPLPAAAASELAFRLEVGTT